MENSDSDVSDTECYFFPNVFSSPGQTCVISNPAFQSVCLNQDVLESVLLRLHDLRCDKITNPIENR